MKKIEEKAKHYADGIAFQDQFNNDTMKNAAVEDFTAGYKQAIIDLQEYTPEQINLMVEALKDCLEDVKIRCNQLGLDPEKYSTYINAVNAINCSKPVSS